MSRWRRLLLIVLAVVVSAMMVVPFVALLTTDFGSPVVARWEEPDKSQDGEQDENQPENRKAVIRFSEADSFNWSSLWLLIPLVLGLGVIYVLAIIRLEEDGADTDFDNWVVTTGIVQAALWLVCVGAAIANNYYFDVAGRLSVEIEDEELAAKALECAHAGRTLVVICAAGCFVVGDIMIVCAAFGTNLLLKTVVHGYARHKERLIESLGGVSGMLSLCPDGTVEQPGYVCRMRWWPFPALVPTREVRGSLPGRNMLRLLARSVPEQSMELLCREVKISLSELFDAVGAKTAEQIVAAIGDEVRDGIGSHVQQAVKRDAATARQEAAALLQGVSDETLQRFQQDLVASVGEAVEGQLSDFRGQAIRLLQQRAAGFGAQQLPDGSAFPDGTKFCMQRGGMTVFVIEEKPQMRTVTFRIGFSKREGSEDCLKENTGFQLAFPYVVFVVRLWRGSFSSLHVFYSRRPLQSLTDRVCWPSLPNIYESGAVCLRFCEERAATLAEEARKVISYFWHSMFNNDLRSRHYDRANPVRDVWDWEEQSKRDPAFVLTADWREREGPLRQLVEQLLAGDSEDEAARAEREVRQSLEQAVAGLTAVVTEACRSLPVERQYTKTVVKKLSSHLLSLASTVIDCVVSRLDDVVASTNSNVRHQFDCHLQRAVNEAVAQTFIGTVASVLLDGGRLPQSLYRALEERRD